MYYRIIRSLSELLGDAGLLRLPAYLPEVFVSDKSRLNAIETAINILSRGKNVLIEGAPGTGKTASMFIILKKLMKQYRIGFIKEGVLSIGNDHIDEGIILFYDDLPRMNSSALRSIIKNRVTGIIATARSEEVGIVRRVHGIDLYEHFEAIKIPPLDANKIREMLIKYLDMEAIRVVDKEAIDTIVQKAQGLPVYVWQIIRELKIKRENLTLEFAKTIPRGMLDYIDNILWRLLGGKAERYEVLLTLLIITDFARYSVHQDLYTYIYMAAKELRIKNKVTIEDIIMDRVIEDTSRYLAREGATYAFRLPHDSWADVLKGKSNGPMAPEISKINTLYDKDKRRKIVIKAARRAWHEAIKNADDQIRVEAFKNNIRVNLEEEILEDIIRHPPSIKSDEKIVSENETAALAMGSLEILRTNLSIAGMAPINMLAKKIGVSEDEIRNLLELADFYMPSKRKGFIYYKDHYLTAIKKAEDIINKLGTLDINTLVEQIKVFREDLMEYLSNKYIIIDNKIYTRSYIEQLIDKELKEKQCIDLKKLADRLKLPQRLLQEIRIKLAEKAIRSPTNPFLFYSRDKIDALNKKILEEISTNAQKTLREISMEFNVSEKDILQLIVNGNLRKQYMIERIRNIITTRKLDLIELKELTKSLEKYELDSEELNIFGIANLLLWEKTGNNVNFEKAVQALKKSGTKKAYENLAIAYAKKKDYRKAKKYAEKAELQEKNMR
ncbi:MAG: hypothetical protein Q6351_010730 [Candidatus Njordarchaeum guaymaensis]